MNNVLTLITLLMPIPSLAHIAMTVSHHRAEQVLNESGVSVAPPRRSKSSAGSMLPPPPVRQSARLRKEQGKKYESESGMSN